MEERGCGVVEVFFDRESLGNYKAQQALQGVRAAVVKRKYECLIRHELCDVPRSEQEGRPIIVFSHSESRSRRILRELTEKRYRPIFIVNRMDGAAVSCVSIDYRQACYRMTCRILENHPHSVALLGFNSDSIPDKQRLEGFEAAVKEYGAEGRMFPNFGDVITCLDAYWENRAAYRNVICVNDILAVALVNRLCAFGEDIQQYQICGFGNTMLSRHCIPRITTVEPNYELAGRCAVELYSVLERNRHVSAITFTVEAEFCEGETMAISQGANALARPLLPPTHGDFYDDSYVMELDSLDGMLSACDETDLGILRGLLSGATYEEICESRFIALNTLKYRVKKLASAARVANRAELVERIQKHRLHI